MPVAESLGVAVLGGVAARLINELINKSEEHLGRDIIKGLEDLETTLIPQFQLTIKAAQNSPHADLLNMWLARLKNAYYDAEAILHDLEYERLRRQVEGAEKRTKKKTLVRISSHIIIKPLAKLTSKVREKVSLLSPQKRKLWRHLNELKEAAAEAKTFRYLLGIQIGDENDILASGIHPSAFLGHKVFGRDEVRDEIIKFLLEEQETSCSMSCYSVVAITGGGGDGKTTLAQYVYNDKRIMEHFGVRRMWISLSHQKNIDIKKRTKEMIECLSRKKCPDLLNETELHARLRKKLPILKAVLLVLDDVWYDKDESKAEQWREFFKPFHYLGGRLKIVLTSRSNSFPDVIHPGKHIPLKHLADDDFQKLFMHHALHGLENNKQVDNLDQLREIGGQIAKSEKMSRSPLAAKVVGNQLRENYESTSFWQATLENVDMSDTMNALQWSYERMDAQLQRCFLFFAVFPKRSARFTASEIVQYWVALDFIQHNSDNRSLDDIGLEYLNKMVASSIFQLVDGWYTMHDLYHDLAEKLSAGDHLRVTDSETTIFKDAVVLHVFLRTNNENLKEKLRSISELHNLRTLILGNSFIDDEDMNEIFSIICKKFKNLRVLEIWSHGHRSLPTVIGDLRNIRCLKIDRNSSLDELPDSVSRLYHLQYLVLPESVKTLPVKLSNLIKLRSIEKYNNKSKLVHFMPPVPYIGKLSSLQHLPEFCVRKEKGYEVGQLGSLSEIRGYLRIVNAENVRNKDEAAKAKLNEKHKLEKLELVWGESAESSLEIDVIEALRPPKNLKLIKIDGYIGSRYPTWLEEQSFLQNITNVSIHNCNALSSPPPNIHQLRHCTTLILENLGAIMELSSFPENLATLRIIKCPSLILARENELEEDMNQLGAILTESHFFELYFFKEFAEELLYHEFKSFEKTGSMENCPEQLQIIQDVHLQVDDAQEPQSYLCEDGFIPTPLKAKVNRAWWSCHQQRMHFIFSNTTRANKLIIPIPRLRILELSHCCISDGALSDCLGGMAALEELCLIGIMTIITLPSAQVLQSLKSLQVLYIKHCWCLRSLGGLHALPQLHEFDIFYCYNLQRTGVQLPPSLRSFTIIDSVLGDILRGNLPCLQNIIIGCHDVSSSMSFCELTSLKSLELFNCANLSLIEGSKERPFIDHLAIVQTPNLNLESVVKCWRGCRHLEISSLEMLNELLSSQDFIPPQILWMNRCNEEELKFHKSDHLLSIKTLSLRACKTKYLPTLSDLSSLEDVIFKHCPEISELPELPDSVEYVEISDCPLLKERCQPNGPEWHKLQHIKYCWIK